MSGDSRAIGIFDSGMGGLTVMAALKAALPHEHFVYLGDTARLPYGSKSTETVRRYAIQAASALSKRDVKLIVIACNTASVSLDAVRSALAPVPVIGVIEPGAEAALAIAPQGPIAVIATESTVNGGAYARAIHARAPDATVTQTACPLLVPIAEDGLTSGPIAEAIVRRYLDPLLAAHKPKCLLLGCTHYPVLKTVIAQVAGEQIALVDSAQTTARAVAALLMERGLAAPQTNPPRDQFLATDAPQRFARNGALFLGSDIAHAELVDL